MDDRSIGERLGDVANAARNKVNEATDRTRAEVHDANSEATNNPVTSVTEKGKAAWDRAKADYHNDRAEDSARDATRND